MSFRKIQVSNINSDATAFNDPLIALNGDETGTNSSDIGIILERGSLTNVAVIWDESEDQFALVSTTHTGSTDGSIPISAYSDVKASTFIGDLTGDVTGDLTGDVTGTVSSLSNHDTDSLSEGSSNLYYTDARWDTRLGTKTTDNLTEGSNLYHTSARVRALLSGAGNISYNSNTGAISYTQPTNVSTFTNDSGYLTSYTETDTLDDVTGRGTTTTNTIDVGKAIVTSTDATSSAGPDLILFRDNSSPNSGDYIGQIQFKGRNSNGGEEIYAKQTGKISDTTNSSEDGLIEYAVKNDGSFVIVSRLRGDKLELINGTSLEVAGTLNTHTIPGGTGTIALTSDLSSYATLAGATFTGDVTVNSSGTSGSANLMLNNSDTANNFGKAIEAFRSGITAGKRHQILLGKDSSNYDTSTISYYYAGDASTSNRLEFGFWNADSLLNVVADGNVGIGTTSPGEKLVVKGDGARITVESDDMEVAMLGRAGSSGSALDQGYLRLRNQGVTADGAVINSAGDSWLNGGNVGIGTESPLSTLHVRSNTQDGTLRVGGSGASLGLELSYDQSGATTSIIQANPTYTNDNQLLKIRADGDRNANQIVLTGTGHVGFGTSTPADSNWSDSTYGNTEVAIDGDGGYAVLHFRGDGAGSTDTRYSMGVGDGKFYMAYDDVVTTHRICVESNGNVGIGTNSPGAKLHVAGDIYATGDVTAYYSSDINLKENIVNIENALDKVNKIRGVHYDWKDEYIEKHSYVEKEDVGVIAQEVEKVLPEIVTDREDGTKAVKYDRLTALLIEAVKELSAKVDAQQEEINILKGK